MTRDFQNEPVLGEEQINDLLDDIEIRCSTDVAAARSQTAVRHKVAMTIRPGNANEREAFAINGESLELRRQGATCLTNLPITVGSVFHVSFDRNALDLIPILAVCDRCTMHGDASFEARFKFVRNIILPTGSTHSRAD